MSIYVYVYIYVYIYMYARIYIYVYICAVSLVNNLRAVEDPFRPLRTYQR